MHQPQELIEEEGKASQVAPQLVNKFVNNFINPNQPTLSQQLNPTKR